MMACVHAEMGTNKYHDSRLIMPLSNDLISWPRSGDFSTPYQNVLTKYYVRDGAKGTFTTSAGSPTPIDATTGANDSDYEPNGATRTRINGLGTWHSGADSSGLEASPAMPVTGMSQIVAQPLFIADSGDGGNSGVAIASPYTGIAKVYEYVRHFSPITIESIDPVTDIITSTDHGLETSMAGQMTTDTTLPTGVSPATDYYVRVIDANTFTLHLSIDDAFNNVGIQDIVDVGVGIHTFTDSQMPGTRLRYTVPLTRTGVTVTTKEDQYHPTAGLVANESMAVTLVGQLNPGVVIADVPITVVVQNESPGLTPTIRSQSGSTTTGIVNDDDETLSLGWTPKELKAEITEGTDGLLYKRSITGGAITWSLV